MAGRKFLGKMYETILKVSAQILALIIQKVSANIAKCFSRIIINCIILLSFAIEALISKVETKEDMDIWQIQVEASIFRAPCVIFDEKATQNEISSK